MFVQTRDEVNLYTKVWGEGRPVVFIHGWPLSADSWDSVAMPIAESGFQTIAYDRRGFGRSDQPWSGYDYDTLSDDLAEVITQLDFTDVTLVGFSMGGGEIARYMSRHAGANVSSAVLVSSVVPFMLQTDDNPDGVPMSAFEQMTESMTADRAAFFGSFFKDFYGVGMVSKPVSNEWLEWTRTVAMSASLKATLQCANSFATTDFRPDLPNFKVPTLIIHGTNDQTVPISASGRPAAAGIANSRLIEYDDAPHGVFATHTQQLIDDLMRFLA
jgi:pimeloyl-ACP methyl ester carboxylesterase